MKRPQSSPAAAVGGGEVAALGGEREPGGNDTLPAMRPGGVGGALLRNFREQLEDEGLDGRRDVGIEP